MSLIYENGCRKMFYLTGNHDDDYFLTEDDMGADHWELLMSCHHQGACDDDCEEAAKYFDFKGSSKAALEYLLDCGIDPERFEDTEGEFTTGQNEDAILQYYLWILAGDIQERREESEG